jgi:hypothetical protein
VCLGPQPMRHVIIISPVVTQEFAKVCKFWASMYGVSGMMVDISAHPQHMHVLKHCVHVLSGFGNHSMWVCGLNQCAMTLFAPVSNRTWQPYHSVVFLSRL